MKIAYIVSSLENAGPINVVLDLVKVMTENGHECEVFYFSNRNAQPFPCKTHKLSFSSPFDWNAYDVIHTHGGRPDGFVFLRKPLKCKACTISTIHSFIFEDHAYKYGRFKSFFTTRAILALSRRHRKVIVLSKTAKEYYTPFISPKRLTYVYNTRVIDINQTIEPLDEISIAKFRKNFDVLIGTACGIHPRKGLEQIIMALPAMPKTGFIAIGDGSSKDNLLQLAADLKCQNQILFLGHRTNAYRYLTQMDIFVIPSRSEGFPLAMLEAASASKAIVSSDIPVFKEFFNDKEVCKFRLDDIPSLVSAIKETVAHKSEYGQNAKARFEHDYSPDCFYYSHLKIYTCPN